LCLRADEQTVPFVLRRCARPGRSTPTPSIYVGKEKYDAILRAGEDPSVVVDPLLAEHLSEIADRKPKPK
jgi:hypothetical protein